MRKLVKATSPAGVTAEARARGESSSLRGPLPARLLRARLLRARLLLVRQLLRGQKGIRHEDIFISPALSEAVLNSYWDSQECADGYGRTTYMAALKALSEVLDGRPRVETFNISSSTFHQITATRRETYRTSSKT
jgi:hypothetical protein